MVGNSFNGTVRNSVNGTKSVNCTKFGCSAEGLPVRDAYASRLTVRDGITVRNSIAGTDFG